MGIFAADNFRRYELLQIRLRLPGRLGKNDQIHNLKRLGYEYGVYALKRDGSMVSGFKGDFSHVVSNKLESRRDCAFRLRKKCCTRQSDLISDIFDRS